VVLGWHVGTSWLPILDEGRADTADLAELDALALQIYTRDNTLRSVAEMLIKESGDFSEGLPGLGHAIVKSVLGAGTFSSSTMMAMMTAMTPSEKASKRARLRFRWLVPIP